MEKLLKNDILNSYLEVINKNYCSFLIHYHLYHEYLLSTSAWEHQEKETAEKNCEVMDQYRLVFSWLNGLLDIGIIELHKLFDKSKPSNLESTINLHFLISYIDEHRAEIKNDKITDLFIEKCRKQINKISNKLTNLWRSRNNRSHNLQTTKDASLKFKDIEDISKVVDELFNFIDSVIRANSWSFDYFNEEPGRDFKLLIKDLEKIRDIRFIIINEKWLRTDTERLNEIKKILHLEYYK